MYNYVQWYNYIHIQMVAVCQKLRQNGVSRWGSLEERNVVVRIWNMSETAHSQVQVGWGVRSPKCCRPVDVDDVKIEGMRNAVLSLQCILYKQDYNIANMQMICMPKYEVSWPVVLVVLVVSIWKGKSLLFLRTMAPYLVNSPWLWCFSSNNALALQGHDVHGTVPTETTWHCQPTFVGDHAAEGWGPLPKSCVWNHYTSLIFLNYYWTS